MEGPVNAMMEKTKGTKLYRPVEAFETFLRTPHTKTASTVHVRDALDSKRMMSTVIVALLPALLFAFWNTGMHTLQAASELSGPFASLTEPTMLNAILHGAWVMLPLIIVSYAVGLGIEFAFSAIRGHEVNEGFLVTGMLIPLIMPAGIPLWMVAMGTAFGVIFGKEVFGGTGYNFLNPALTTRAFIFFSYPTKISGDEVWIAAEKLKDFDISGITGATPLAVAANADRGANVVEVLAEKGYTFKEMLLGTIPGSTGETSLIAIAIGALILLVTKVGSWRIMLSTFIGGYAMGSIFGFFQGPDAIAFLSLPAHYHLIMGGFAFGAVFMTTDPVSAAATNKGQYIYGFLVGALAILIRVANPAYPEGVMLAILFMNVFAPLIDHYVVNANVKRRKARAQQ
jgi:Na+-transporting NADH:ubiquinone oxidoreductase subunit B